MLGMEDRSDGLNETLPMAKQVLVVPVQKEAAVGRVPRTAPGCKEAGLLHSCSLQTSLDNDRISAANQARQSKAKCTAAPCSYDCRTLLVAVLHMTLPGQRNNLAPCPCSSAHAQEESAGCNKTFQCWANQHPNM